MVGGLVVAVGAGVLVGAVVLVGRGVGDGLVVRVGRAVLVGSSVSVGAAVGVTDGVKVMVAVAVGVLVGRGVLVGNMPTSRKAASANNQKQQLRQQAMVSATTDTVNLRPRESALKRFFMLLALLFFHVRLRPRVNFGLSGDPHPEHRPRNSRPEQ